MHKHTLVHTHTNLVKALHPLPHHIQKRSWMYSGLHSIGTSNGEEMRGLIRAITLVHTRIEKIGLPRS
jgi:hypothetical protein